MSLVGQHIAFWNTVGTQAFVSKSIGKLDDSIDKKMLSFSDIQCYISDSHTS